MRAQGLGAVALLMMAGCAAETKLRPAPEAGVLQNNQGGAITEQQGVRLIANGSAWKGQPSNLERRLTPVSVRLENQSPRALRVQYSAFSLVGQESRFRYGALPPLSLRQNMSSVGSLEQGTLSDSAVVAFGGAVPVRGPYRYGPRRGWSPWYGPWGSPFYGPGPYPYVERCEEPLPTADMLNNALPEGTLEPGGRLQGFLYFQGVGQREDAVTLQMKLVDVETGESFGALDIPFQVSTK
jgi:hypothetical protein